MAPSSAPSSLRVLLKLLRTGVRRGYAFTPPAFAPDVVESSFVPYAKACDWWWIGVRVMIILPSTSVRCSPAIHAEGLHHLLEQVSEASGAALVFALQDTDPVRLATHLKAVEKALGPKAHGVLFFPILGLGKTAALNAVMRNVPAEAIPDLVGWVDDDVRLGHGTLARMATAMTEDAALLVVGANKVPIPYKSRAARAFLWLKRTARPEGTLFWPHGCTIMLRSSMLKDGLPLRYGGEDGYLVLKAFGTGAAGRRSVALIDGTSCRHVVGGPWWEIVPRVKRTLYENAVLLADSPPAISLAFARDAIFHGLYAPNSTVSARLLGAAHFLFYFWIGLALIGRGLVGRPKRFIAWSGYSTHARPDCANGHNGSVVKR